MFSFVSSYQGGCPKSRGLHARHPTPVTGFYKIIPREDRQPATTLYSRSRPQAPWHVTAGGWFARAAGLAAAPA